MRRVIYFAGLFLLLSGAHPAWAQVFGVGFNAYGGLFAGSSDLTHAVNPDMPLNMAGIPYAIDFSCCMYGDSQMVLPALFYSLFSFYSLVPDAKGLKLPDGTLFPADEAGNPFEYYDFNFEIGFCYPLFKAFETKDFSVIVSPKIGFCSHFLYNTFNIYMSRFNGKTGTTQTYGDDFYHCTVGPDLYGVQVGAILAAPLFESFVRVDLDASYLPLGPVLSLAPGTSWYSHFTDTDGDVSNVSVTSLGLLNFKINASYYVYGPLHADLRLLWNVITANGFKPVSFFGDSLIMTDLDAVGITDFMIMLGVGITIG